jgi:hypothetical protein
MLRRLAIVKIIDAQASEEALVDGSLREHAELM